MATSKLSLYNEALTVHLSSSALGVPNGLSENNPVRYALDGAWDADLVDTCLQAGQWNFATRTVMIEASPSVTPDFGFQYAFDKPEDFMRVTGVFSDPECEQPLREYFDEASWWWANMDTIYIRYVSNDVDYGADFSLWPKNFARYVACYLASRACRRITGSEEKALLLEAAADKLLKAAKGTDAMEEASIEPPPGTWSTARRSGGRQRDRGSRNQLIG